MSPPFHLTWTQRRGAVCNGPSDQVPSGMHRRCSAGCREGLRPVEPCELRSWRLRALTDTPRTAFVAPNASIVHVPCSEISIVAKHALWLSLEWPGACECSVSTRQDMQMSRQQVVMSQWGASGQLVLRNALCVCCKAVLRWPQAR